MFKLVMRIIIIIIFIIALPTNDIMAKNGGGFDIGATSIASAAQKIQWHGYYEFEYWNTENNNNSFDAHKITIWMGVPINDKVFLSSEMEYEHFPRLRDKTQRAGGSGEIKVDSAQLRITPIENSVAYLGIFYVPFGIEYLSYPGQKNKLVTRPKVMKSGGVIPGTWSDVGIGFNQTFSGIGQVDFFVLNGDAKNGGISRDSSSGGNDNKSLGGRIMLDGLFEGLNVGASYVSGKWDTNDDNVSDRWGVHLRVDSNKIFGIDMAPVIIAEYVTGKDENASSVANIDKKVSGFYAQISSWIHPNVEIVARYGQYDNDKEKTDNRKSETSVGFILYLLDNFQIKGEYQWNQEEGSKVDNNTAVLQVVAYW